MNNRVLAQATGYISVVDDIISIKSADVVFTVGTSATIPPDDNGWKTLFSELVLTTDGYVWTCTKIVKTDDSVEYSGKHCLGKCSDFADVIELYALGDNNVTPPDSGWKQSYTPVKGKWLWTKNELHFQNSSQVITTDPICIGYFAKDGESGTSFTLKGTAYGHYNLISQIPNDSSWPVLADSDDTGTLDINVPCVRTKRRYNTGWQWSSPFAASIGDAYIIDGILWVNNGKVWVEAGNIQGPAGEQGDGAMWAVLTKNQVIFETDADGSIPKTSKSTMIRVFVGSELIEPSKYNIAISNAENYDVSKVSLTKSDYSTTLNIDSSGITIKNTGENINSACPYSSIRIAVTYGDYSLFINVNIVVDDSKHITEISLTVTSLHDTLDTYERAGLLTRQNFSELFAEYKKDGEVVSRADMGVAIEDGISKASINAEQVNINADHMLNITGNYMTVDATNFKLDKNGNVSMSGEVNATSGKVAGMSISGNGLTNAGFNNDAYIILRNDNANAFAGIGANILPSETSMRAIARFANEDASTKNVFGSGRNIAMLLSAKNSDYNMAFGGSGCGFLDGYISGYGFEEMTLSEKNTCHIIHPKKSLLIISNQTEQTASIGLPTLASVRSLLGIGSSEKFAVPIEIILRGNRYGFIYGRNTYVKGMDTSDYPGVEYTQGKKVQYNTGISYVDYYFTYGYNKFILIYDGSSYYAITVKTSLYQHEEYFDN